MATLPRRAGARSGHAWRRAWFWSGIAATTIIAILDAAAERDVLLTGVLAGPLLAAIGGTTVEVLIVGAYAVLVALGLGAVDDIFGERDHVIRVAIVTVASVVAVLSAR